MAVGGRWVPAAIVLGALLLRALLAFGSDRPLASDERDFDELARGLSETGRYTAGGVPTAYRPVGYPAFAALLYRAAPRGPVAVRAAQAVLDAATALLLFLLLRRRDRGAALLAASFWALYTPAILFSSLLLAETLFVFLLVAFAGAVLRATRSSLAWSVAAGLLLGFLTLVKPFAILALIPLPLALGRLGVPGRSLGVLGLTALLTIAPWLARNASTVGSASLSTNVGANLFVGNNPNANGAYAVPEVPAAVSDANGEAEGNRQAALAALRYIGSDPGRFLIMGLKKWAYLVSSEAELAVGFLGSHSGSGFREAHRALPVWAHAAVSLPYAFLLVFGTLGFWTRPSDALSAVFLSVVLSGLVVHFVTFGGSRFHFPWMPFLAVFAAEFLLGWRERVRAASRARLATAAALVVLYGGVWVAEFATAAG